ncbi:phosphonate metabolism protein/1,5-bisphosphokinase (PRPP-forming) PhnN [Rhodobacteraceae bacterium KMM 6894]|nr:phosphonate metabolism protein/1,5-bisphosphokinase (PRPP-forming) PhnN [Rhodobacteraceae bacterium KMM 6894]
MTKPAPPGTLFLIVGPSGVGKDTLLDGAREQLGNSRWFSFPRRIITRPTDAGGEDHIATTEADFDAMRAAGGFFHTWGAHGLHYGLPATIRDDLAAGINVVVNTSRAETVALRDKAADVVTIYISASPDVVEQRLRARGRETDAEIEGRLARIAQGADTDDGSLEILNDSSVEDGISALVELIAGSCNLRAEVTTFPAEFGSRPMCLVHQDNLIAARLLAGSERVTIQGGDGAVVAELGRTQLDTLANVDQCALSTSALSALNIDAGDVVMIERSPSPKSRSILQKKVRGGNLTHDEMEAFVHDLVAGKFSTSEIAGFLVAASTNLTLDEVVSLTRVRAEFAYRQTWDADIVVDKHSMGGIPGNRITPIVIPIIAAHGLIMPKTSSRAITSAAGTADMMEVLARVDLTPAEMKRVVTQTGACIAWNGRLTHSPVDDVMNAINRPLGLSSALLDVSSIMSKKLAAGSTHVLIDMPVGPSAKTKTLADAQVLKDLFENVGQGVGLKTRVNISDGTRPIGRGVGPVLETIDVLSVLRNEADAPQDLRAKSVDYAALILEWAGGVAKGAGRATAEALIDSGQAHEKLMQIADSQGRRDVALEPGRFTRDVLAQSAGVVSGTDISAVARIARAAGAPVDKAAGVVVLAAPGQTVVKGQPLLRLHAASTRGLDEALTAARGTDAIFQID